MNHYKYPRKGHPDYGYQMPFEQFSVFTGITLFNWTEQEEMDLRELYKKK